MRLALSLLIALTPATCDEGNVPPRRGPFAFHYSASLTDEQLAWYSRFELLVTHDPLPPEQVARLHGAGTRLVLYHYVMTNMIEPAMKRYPKVRFGHLNYGADAETIRIVVAVAHLFGGEGFVAAPATADEADPIYFRDPGKPVSRRMDIADGKVSYRCFEHGLIAVTSAAVDVAIAACGEAVVLRATGGEPRVLFDNTSDCKPR